MIVGLLHVSVKSFVLGELFQIFAAIKFVKNMLSKKIVIIEQTYSCSANVLKKFNGLYYPEWNDFRFFLRLIRRIESFLKINPSVNIFLMFWYEAQNPLYIFNAFVIQNFIWFSE